MNTKEIILNSGFSYQELLTMKNNFHAMRKWYRLEKKPVPATEPESFQKYIVTTAESASCCTLIISIISLIQAIYLRLEHHDIKSLAVALVIYLIMFFIIIYSQKNSTGLKMVTIVKLIALHYKIKMKTCISKFSLK
ncbi:hypothetical protein AB1E22_18230 [Buttiauxella gaviniae]|uniref:SMODS and SLOG-associating 2TM effector domain-containing protein n=1 Tax=Buttiauxella gaviniae TaxID=82990 RepID=A0ABV3NYN0_9ENTR